MSWDEIGLLHQTDKASSFHGYMDAYEAFMDEASAVLEIGIDCGNSLRMWAEIFPSADIFGIDNRPECIEVAVPQNVGLRIADATDSDVLTEAGLGSVIFDLIVDDGSHQVQDAMTTFGLFWPARVAPGGVYAIEDLPMGGRPDTPMGLLAEFLVNQPDVAELRIVPSRVQWGDGHPGLALVRKSL